MTQTWLERMLLLALALVVALALLGIPFGNVHFSRWTLELEREPHPLWIAALVVVDAGLFVVFAAMSKKVRAALQNCSHEVRHALQPAVWTGLSVAAFALTQALFVMATLSPDFFQAARIPLVVPVGLSLVSLGIWMTVLTRRLKNEPLKEEWERLLISRPAGSTGG